MNNLPREGMESPVLDTVKIQLDGPGSTCLDQAFARKGWNR